MDLSSTLFTKPKLRSGVNFDVNGNSLDINYHNQGCDIDCEDISPDVFDQFMQTVQSGSATVAQLNENFPDLAGAIEDMLIEFDRLGLLEEAELKKATGVLSGRDFYFSRLLPCIQKVQGRLGDSVLYKRMLTNEVTKNELLGFALEYYHLVKLSPSLISPSLCHVSNESVRKQLLKLFVEEYDHDKMMVDCLKSVGIDEEQLLIRQPLPTSFSAYASLGVYARQHVLSFYSALILFESPSHRFNDVFVEACKSLDFPEGFYKPLVKHSDINEDGNHDAVTLELLSEVPLISAQEQDTILIHITALVEMLYKQDQHIVDYYSQPESDLMRVYAA